MVIPLVQLGNKLKQLRKKNGMTQEQLAKQLGITRQAISKWESDIAQPDIDNLAKICDIFNISADILLEIQVSSSLPSTKTTIENHHNANFYKKISVICLAFLFFDILLVYLMLFFRPELRITENNEILHFMDLRLWMNEYLFPLFIFGIISIMCSILFYKKYLNEIK